MITSAMRMTYYFVCLSIILHRLRRSGAVMLAMETKVPLTKKPDITIATTGAASGTDDSHDARNIGDSETDNAMTTDWVTVAGSENISEHSGNLTETTTEVPKSVKINPYAIIHQGSVSKKQYETCSFVINVVLKLIVCVAGVVMNVIGVCVLLQKQFRRSTYTYLCFLALADLCILLGEIVLTIPKVINLYDDVLANYLFQNTFPYLSIFSGSAFSRISQYIICSLAIERFVAVMLPLKVKDLFLCRHAFGVCIGVSMFCILTHVHYLFIYYPKPYFDGTRNITMYALGRRSWYTDTGIKPVYNMVYEILYFYAPIITLITCNVGILIRVRQMNKERRNIVASVPKSDKMSQDEKRMTLTLLIISFTFLSVFVPLAILTFIQKFHNEIKIFGREHYLLQLIIDIISLGWNISSANDFIVYIYTSKQFKKALVKMMCRGKGTKSKSGCQGPYTVDSQYFTKSTEASVATDNHM